MYGSNYYGSLVFAAGLLVTSQTPIPPSSGGNGYGTADYAQGVYGAGLVVTGQTPVPPPSSSKGNGYACVYYGAGVYGAGFVITSKTPIPQPSVDGGNSSGGSPKRARRAESNFARPVDERQRDAEKASVEQRIADDDEEIIVILSLWMNLKE